MEKVRTILSGVGFTQVFWEKGVDATCYLMKRSLLTALVNKSPYEACVGKNTSLTHLEVFGCGAFMHILEGKITKLDNKLEKCIFIG